jgi:DNA-3-methyladenine glycosylase
MVTEEKLPLSFYASHDTLTLAEKLLGCELIHDSPDGITAGIIVETEAYLRDDPACHAYNRRTARTEPMYAVAGTIYVYLIYGMYQCVNVVSNKQGVGEAVLIRALQPTQGIDLMQMRRSLRKNHRAAANKDLALKDLCNGPGKLVVSMGINAVTHNNQLLTESSLFIKPAITTDLEIATSTRIGITVGTELPYRFMIKNSAFLSRKHP